MTIKITGLELYKDTTHIKSTPTEETHTLISLEGDIELEVSHGQFKGRDYINVSKVSEGLKKKLYDVLIDIEKELENKEPIKIKEGKYYESNETIANKENLAKLHTEEKVLNKCEAEEILKAGKIFDSIIKNIPNTLGKLHETDTNKDVDVVSEALDNAEKVFNIVFNLPKHDEKSVKDFAEELAKTIRTKGLW